MNTQSDKNQKPKIITIFLVMFFILAGGGLLARKSFGSDVEGPVIMFLFALCFIVLAIWSKKNWWAIILGGIFASIGLVVVLDNFIPHEEYPSLPNTLKWGVYTWVLLLGLAATFGFVWLRRKTQPTGWAMYPAAGLLVMAVLAFILGSRFNEIWLSSVVLVVGVVFVLAKIIERKLDAGRQISNVKV